MPLELFDGKTGVRLIAREPTDPATTAAVVVRSVGTIQVYAPEGLLVHGYPGLSVVIDSLPPKLASKIEAHRRAELDKLDADKASLARLIDLNRRDQGGTAAVLAPLRARTNSIHDQHRAKIERPPTLTSIAPGRTLSAYLPVVYGKTVQLRIGVIERVLV